MDHRMRVISALICFMIISSNHAFIPGADGPVLAQEALEGGNITLLCDSTTDTPNDELMLLVWYKDNVPVYSYDARINSEWSSTSFNSSNRLRTDLQKQPTVLIITQLRGDDQALYHCRVDFLLAPTRNLGVNLTIIELPSQPFFLDEVGNKVEGKIGPYHEGDTLVLSCLVIGGRPPPRISWYAGNDLVDASDGISDIPNVRENELYLPLTRNNADSLSCRAINTDLRPPIVTTLQVELYLPAYNVSIHWVRGTVQEALLAGRRAVVQCVVQGSYPPPELSWWLDRRHLTQYSNQSWSNATRKAESFLELTPAVSDNGATLACVATNTALAPGKDSKADIVILNVTYSPIVEITKLGDGRLNEVSELDSLQLECEVRANPPVDNFTWYFNDIEIRANSLWGSDVFSQTLLVEEAVRRHAGRYSCAARNHIGETRAETINISVLYPPECMEQGLTLVKENLKCNVKALPRPDTFFWYIQALDEDIQHLTTGSPILPLTQITGSLSRSLEARCEAGNGIASQEKPCKRTFTFDLLRPPQPQQCDLAYEYEEFQMRCIPVENATYYEVSLWRMSTSNASLVLERRGSMGYGMSQALAQGEGIPWLVRGPLGNLRVGDEAGASACNRYGCSTALLLRPTDNLLHAAAAPWWKFLLERDVGISIGAVVLVAVFLLSSVLVYRVARRARTKPTPVIQVLQLDDVARDYLDTIGDSPIVEITKLGDGRLNEVSELDSLQLECEVRANPPVDNFTWYFNDIEIRANSLWGSDVFSQTLLVEEAVRRHAGRYSCAARNHIGETRAETINISVLYPPECMEQGLTLVKENLKCNVKALPRPDTFFWHIQALDEDIQHLTTGSPILPLTQITGSLSRSLEARCEAGNGIASQEKPCKRTFTFDLLRPPQPQQCDLAYEYEEFQMRCIPVENATYYEVSLWRMSTSNASLVLERRGSMGYGMSQALAQGEGIPWLVRGPLGNLRVGDEAGASACNRYGCSTALLLRPTDNLLHAAAAPWWKFLLERDVGISIGAVVLVAVFLLSSVLVYRVARRARTKPTPVIQVLQLDDVARDYLDTIGEHKVRASCSLRSCSSGYSDGSGDNAPTIDRHRKPRVWTWETPPPDVTLTLHRESAV